MRTSMMLVALGALLPACNALIGVEDVELVTRASCGIAASVSLTTANLYSASLRHATGGGPSLLFLLNGDPKPDAFSMLLYDGMGGHPSFASPGTYALTASDAELATCGICATVLADIDLATTTVSQTYRTEAQGQLVLTRVDASGLAGKLTGLRLRHVANLPATDDVADGCDVQVGEAEFDASYDDSVAADIAAVAQAVDR